MLTAAELASMRAAQVAAMNDTCTLRTWTPTVDAFGSEVEGWTDRTGVRCGLDVSSTRQKERRRSDGTISISTATLRLSLADGVTVGAKDAVLITHRHGEALATPLRYQVDGAPEVGPTGVVVRLVEVE